MTNAVIGALRVTLGLDSAKFESGADRAKSKLSGLSSAFKSFAAGLASGLTFAAVTTALSSVINKMDDLSKTAQRVGLPVQQLSELEYAARLSDVSLEDLQSTFSKFNKSLGEIASGGFNSAKAAMDAIGVQALDSAGKLKSTDVIISEIATKFASFEDGANKSALSIALFGKSGANIIPLLNQGAAGLQEAADEARRFGLVLDGEAGVSAENFNDNLTRIQAAGQGLVQQVVSQLLPTMVDLTNQFVASIGSTKELADTIVGNLSIAFETISSYVATTIGEFKALNTIFSVMEENFSNPQGLSVAIERWNAAFDEIKKGAIETQGQLALIRNVGDDPTGSLASIDSLVSKSKSIVPKVQAPVFSDKDPSIAIKKAQAESARLAKQQASEAARRQKEINDTINGLKFEGLQMQRNGEQQAIQNALRQAGVTITSAQGREIAKLASENFKLEESQKRQKENAELNADAEKELVQIRIEAGEKLRQQSLEQQENIRSGFEAIAQIGYSAFESIALGGAKASDAIRDMAKQLASAALQALLLGQGPLAALFNGGQSEGGGVFGFLAQAFKLPSFQGFYEKGGNFSANRPMVVGEGGAELIVPSSAGRVIPNTALGGTGSRPNVIYNIDATGADQAAISRLQMQLSELARNQGRNAVSAVNRERNMNASFA